MNALAALVEAVVGEGQMPKFSRTPDGFWRIDVGTACALDRSLDAAAERFIEMALEHYVHSQSASRL